MDKEELVTLHRSGDRIKAARLAVGSAIGSQPGQAHVDICTACQERPISDVLEVMSRRTPDQWPPMGQTRD